MDLQPVAYGRTFMNVGGAEVFQGWTPYWSWTPSEASLWSYITITPETVFTISFCPLLEDRGSADYYSFD